MRLNLNSTKDRKEIAKIANQLYSPVADSITWKHYTNRLYVANLTDGEGKEFRLTFMYKYKQFQIEKCSVTNTVFIHLYQGETLNVCVDINGNLCHTRGGQIVK